MRKLLTFHNATTTMQKFLTEDVSLPSAFDSLKFASSNEKHYADQGGDVSSAWNLCARSSDIILQGNQCWHRDMSPVFSRQFKIAIT